jgi:rhodanese-related sulfurtransferase
MSDPKTDLPQAKQTVLGLYLTAREAWQRCLAEPAQVKLIDVRTPEELLFVGHAPLAWNVPAFAQVYEWDAGKGKFPMTYHPDFVARVRSVAGPGDTLLVMCRSGGRSALAANLLAQAGFTEVFNVVDGMEGDTVSDPGSAFHGQRLRNGWKNSGCPWTYGLTPERLLLPGREPGRGGTP